MSRWSMDKAISLAFMSVVLRGVVGRHLMYDALVFEERVSLALGAFAPTIQAGEDQLRVAIERSRTIRIVLIPNNTKQK